MIHLVGRNRDPVDERDAVGELAERERLRERVAAAGPTRELAERALNFQVRQLVWHVVDCIMLRRSARPPRLSRRCAQAGAILTLVAAAAHAQDSTSHPWPRFIAGAVTSILAHEAGHVATSLALGARPTFGFDEG